MIQFLRSNHLLRSNHRTIKGKQYRDATFRLRRCHKCHDFGPFYPEEEEDSLATKINSSVRYAGDTFLAHEKYLIGRREKQKMLEEQCNIWDKYDQRGDTRVRDRAIEGGGRQE